jgi:hypothetical protein
MVGVARNNDTGGQSLFGDNKTGLLHHLSEVRCTNLTNPALMFVRSVYTQI